MLRNNLSERESRFISNPFYKEMQFYDVKELTSAAYKEYIFIVAGGKRADAARKWKRKGTESDGNGNEK